MIGHSGLLNLGERFVWWLFQLTKRDMAISSFFFCLHYWVWPSGSFIFG